uniref:Uncharacterized protein n=1 Tax=Fagus sylvatica TaxID=28930 RepID=A0A2N9GW06_FAGSY
MQHIAGKLSTSSFQRYEVCVNRSSDERVMAPGSRGIGAVFVHLSGEDSDQMGDAFGKPRVPRRSWSRYLSNAPGLVDQLVASRKDSAREGGCPGGKTQATGVFLVRLRAVFRSGFRLDLIKSWRSESSTSCMSVSSFQRTRACGSTCCESGRLCAQAWQRRWEDSGNFSTALFRQPVFTRMVDIAPDVGFRQSWYRRKAGATYFPKVQALHRGELGFARYDPANGGRWNVPYAKGMVRERSVRFSFRSGQQSGQTLVKLGQPWSKFGQNSPNLREMYPEPRFEGFWARWTPVGLGTARSNLGQTSVNPGQTWSTLVKPWEMCPGPSSLGVFDATRLRWIIRAGSGSPRHACRHSRKSCGSSRFACQSSPRVQMDIPKVENDRTRTPIDDQFSPIRPTAYLGGNVCAKILSDPQQLGPRAKTLRQEVHFSYHTQLSDRQELLRSSRNLSQKMTPWHKEHSDGLLFARSYLANPSSPLCKACTVEKVFLTRNKLIHEPRCVGKKTHSCTTWNSRIAKILSGPSRNPDRKTALKRTKNTPAALARQRKLFADRELGQICARTGTRFEKKRAGSKTHFFSRTAAFARRVFPARNKLIREPGCVGKMTTPATTWNSRFAGSIPRLTGIFAGKVHEKTAPDDPDFREP